MPQPLRIIITMVVALIQCAARTKPGWTTMTLPFWAARSGWEGDGSTAAVYIGGVRPSLPMLMLAAVTVPSAERWPLTMTLAPTFRAVRSVGS
jgi:hypothetical protein